MPARRERGRAEGDVREGKRARGRREAHAAYRRKMGKSAADVVEAVCEEYESVRLGLARCHKEGVSGVTRRRNKAGAGCRTESGA